MFTALVAMTLCCYIVGQGLNAGTSVYLAYRGSTATLAGIGAAAFSASAAVSRIICGPMADLRGRIAVITAGAIVLISGTICFISYLLIAITKIPVMGLVGCMACGFSVGIMWPGSISISSRILPAGDTAMFALLALAGDLGGALGPAIIGTVSQNAGNNLQAGVLAGRGFPIVLVLCVFMIRKQYRASSVK